MSGKGIVIVGGGHGGSQIAASLRGDGYDGPLTLVTAERDVPYQRPPLSKAFLKDPAHDLCRSGPNPSTPRTPSISALAPRSPPSTAPAPPSF